MAPPRPRCQWCPAPAITRRFFLWGPYDLCRECADAVDRSR